MDKSAASAFVYAKASGMLSKSYIGERTAKLFEAKSLQDLWTLVFNTEVPLVPEIMLAKQIEQKAEETFIKEFVDLLSCYEKPEPVSVALLQYYEYCNLKQISTAIFVNKKTLPNIINLGQYSVLDYKAYPNIEKITDKTQFSWYKTVPTRQEQKDVDHKLDVQYIRSLWDAVQKVPSLEREPVKKLILDEINMNNCLWAIRLKVYYNMSKEDIILQLAAATENPSSTDILAGEAIKLLDFAIDSYEDWKNWKYATLLNPHEEGSVWIIDPRWVQQAANVQQNKKALRQFHQHPFTADVLVSWFKIKQHELNCIRTAAEGLRLAVSESQLKEFAGVV